MSDFNKDEYLNDLPDMDNLSGRPPLRRCIAGIAE